MAENQKSEVRSQELGVRNQESESIQKPVIKAEPTEDTGEDAEVATKTNEVLATNENATPSAPDDEGYVWPEGTEAATEIPVQNGVAPEVVNIPLPSLDELMKRIPPAVLATLDDLFRVKFVSVKRTNPTSLKS